MPVEPRYHTAEHILTAVVGEIYGGEVVEIHFKGNKARCDYRFVPDVPLEEAIRRIEKRVNEVISGNHDVAIEFASREEAVKLARLKKVPEEKNKIRLIKIGGFDTTACSGEHVKNTSEIGRMEIRTFHQLEPGIVRLTFMI
jgi:misacylated tRNA(Ala) deacylase